MTTSSVDESYGAIERAYGQGQFEAALQLALALQSRLAGEDSAPSPPGAIESLSLRLELLLGHIYFYGLGNSATAQAHYETVARSAPDSTLAQLARSSLQQCQSEKPPIHDPGSPAPSAAAGEVPAVPWLNHLQDSRQALEALQAAWSTVVVAEPPPAPPVPLSDNGAEAAATPWASAEEPPGKQASPPPQQQSPDQPPPPQPALPASKAAEPDPGPDFSQGSLLVTLLPASSPMPANKKACPEKGQAAWRQILGKALSWRRSDGGGSGH